MSKKVSLGAIPPEQKIDNKVDSCAGSEPMRRLTIDVSASLHTRIKSSCAMRGHKMADEIRELLTEKYGE